METVEFRLNLTVSQAYFVSGERAAFVDNGTIGSGANYREIRTSRR